MSPVLGQIEASFYYLELTTPRHENKKIRHKKEIWKANESAPGTSDLSNDTNKHTKKSPETIPLS
jgi:predicted RNA-binding protein